MNEGTVSILMVSKDKPGRTDGKNSPHRSGGFLPKKLNNEIVVLLQANRDKAALKDKKVSARTQDIRETSIKGFFSDLLKLGYKIETVNNLKEKHLLAVFSLLEEKRQAPATIQNKISTMRTFCGWIGKAGMVRKSTNYVQDSNSTKRSMVVKEDKSWEGKGIDVLEMLPLIEKEDRNVALYLELCWAFGLRMREAIMLRPAVSQEGSFIWLREGTKGDRARVIPIENEVQINVLERAIAMSDGKSGQLGVRGKTVKQKVRRFYTVMGKCGITLRDNDITAHGLRHQYMQQSFKLMLGIEAPVRGGDLSLVDKDKLHLASQKLMERAGHTRVTIGASYYGSRRIPRKKKSLPENDAAVDDVEIPKKLSDLNNEEGE